MSNFQIPLNGSNHISKERQQRFQDALNDNHVIKCSEEMANQSADNGKPPQNEPQGNPTHNVSDVQKISSNGNGYQPTPELIASIETGLNHTFALQNRTIEIHQKYLDQQQEYTQLISAFLNQQGKVLENGHSSASQEILDTLRRSLENIHQVREKGMQVHQQFLAQQAEFSNNYVKVLERQHDSLQNGSKQPTQVYPENPDSIVIDETDLGEKVPRQELAPQTMSELIPETDVIEPPVPITPEDQEDTPEISPADLSAALLRIVGEKTGYPAEMLELEMDLEADLGIDSIKRVEILGALEEEFPSLPPADTEVLAQTRTLDEIVTYMNSEAGHSAAPNKEIISSDTNQEKQSSQPAIQEAEVKAESGSESTGQLSSVEELTAVLLEIVAEKTGYPAEMLESGMDMEADLGIDSIKRVEILGAMEEQVPGLPQVEAEVLADLRTLGEIVELMSSSRAASDSSFEEKVGSKKKVNQPGLDITPAKLIRLPAPDSLEFHPSQDRPVIVTDDGGDLTPLLVEELTHRGWKVILWRLPVITITRKSEKIPEAVDQITQEESTKDAILESLKQLRRKHNSFSGLIHLHPLSQGTDVFSEHDRNLVKSIFFLVGALKNDLNNNQMGGRSLFMTVTRSDGQLGLTGSASFQEAVGLTGVVKTLHWEWPQVFCRAVDLDPTLPEADQANSIIQEIHDPDIGLVEVGISPSERVTIVRDYREEL